MQPLQMRRIRCSEPDAARRLAALRQQLNSQADVVSARGRQVTEMVFGAPLTPTQVVQRICTEVRARGLPAVLDYTEKLDRVRLTEETLRVRGGELAEAHAAADPAFLEAVRRVRQN